jgi:hypothetical protein
MFPALFLVFMGSSALLNFASKPGFETTRPIDVVRLIGAGMCFGAALVMFVMFLRGKRGRIDG